MMGFGDGRWKIYYTYPLKLYDHSMTMGWGIEDRYHVKPANREDRRGVSKYVLTYK